MRSAFDHTPAFDHVDEIGMKYGRQTMGDDERRLALRQLAQLALNDVLGFAIPSGLSHASIISERQGAKSPGAKSNQALFEPAADAALNGD